MPLADYAKNILNFLSSEGIKILFKKIETTTYADMKNYDRSQESTYKFRYTTSPPFHSVHSRKKYANQIMNFDCSKEQSHSLAQKFSCVPSFENQHRQNRIKDFCTVYLLN